MKLYYKVAEPSKIVLNKKNKIVDNLNPHYFARQEFFFFFFFSQEKSTRMASPSIIGLFIKCIYIFNDITS